jgi:integrase
MALSDVKIRTAKPQAHRYRLTDSHGLSIEVSPSSTPSEPKKYWRYRYRLGGKENLFAAGEWCQAPIEETAEQAADRQQGGRLTLAEARLARVTWRAQVKSGHHPRLVRAARQLLASQSAASTFKAVADEFVERRGGKWSESHRQQFLRFIEQDAYPDLGALPIASLGPGHVLAVLRKVEGRGAHRVAHMGRGYLGQVFRYAVVTHKATQDPTRALAGALTKAETKHHPPLARDDIGPFLQAVETKANANRQTVIAVRLLLLTMTRTVELRTAWWPDVDLARAEWRIPPERMKMRRPHIVPLSRQSVELLQELRAIAGNSPRLFPNARDPEKTMGVTTLSAAFVRAGYAGKFSPHGFRATASTMLREAGFEDRLIELQLAHIDRNKSRASYDHAERLEPRRAMLQAWADMIDAAMTTHRDSR